MKCDKCGFDSPAEMHFCGKCGCELTASSNLSSQAHSLEEKLARIQSYLPEGLTKKFLAQKERFEGERRRVTIMFCDMKGFTPLTHRLGPEETFVLMERVLEIMILNVHHHEGTVNEIRGDGVLALFGALDALEDSPLRGIRASLAIHTEIADISEKIIEFWPFLTNYCGRWVDIIGEAGIGKSRLMAELKRREATKRVILLESIVCPG